VSTFSVPGAVATGLSAAADLRGDEVLAWQSCTPSGACAGRAALRRAGGAFGRVLRLGAIDATDFPAAAVAPDGTRFVGWISGGHVLAAVAGARASSFAAPHLVSGTSYAADLRLAGGPRGSALAVWAQGTLTPEIVGAAYR